MGSKYHVEHHSILGMDQVFQLIHALLKYSVTHYQGPLRLETISKLSVWLPTFFPITTYSTVIEAMVGQGVSSFQTNFTQKINLGITEIVEFTTRSTPSTYYSVLYLIKKRA